jgi:hypothetical protein
VPDLLNNMKKIKVIKREDVTPKASPTNKKAAKRLKPDRSMENTVKDWITERRENDDAESRSLNSQLADWNTDTIPA